MEEEKDLDMGLFGESNMQLNMPLYDLQEETIEEDEEIINDGSQADPNLKHNNDTVENEDSEEVDGEEDDTDEGDGDSGENSSSNLYSSLATVVYEQGLLPSLDIDKINDIKDVNGLVEAFKVEKEILAKQQLDEYVANLDTSTLAQAKQTYMDLESITEDSLKENLELAKQIIYQDYINQGLDETKVTRHLKRIIDLGEDAILEEASDSLVSAKEYQIKQIEEAKLNSIRDFENQKAEQAKLDEQLKKTVYESTDLIKGFKPTKALQDKVYKSINDIVGKSPEGYFENKFMRERRENPIEFETRMYMFYELTNGFKDYSKVSTSAKSSAVKDLEKIAQQTRIKDNGTPIWMQDSESYGGMGVELNL